VSAREKDVSRSAPRRSGSETRQRANGAVLVRLLPDERARIEAKARAAGLSLAAYLRACALGDAGPRARRSAPVNAELLARATAQLNKVGSNLNQIAHALNGKDSPYEVFSVETLAEVRQAVADIREAVGRRERP